MPSRTITINLNEVVVALATGLVRLFAIVLATYGALGVLGNIKLWFRTRRIRRTRNVTPLKTQE